MPNRFNTLLPEQQYVSSVVPLPLDLLYKTGQVKQGEHDKQLEDTYKMEDLMKSVNAIDEHKPFKRQLENKYLGQINDVADQIQKTGTSDPGQIRRIARNWEADPLRQELETSYANRQLEQKKKIELGDKYAPWGDPNAGFQGQDANGNIQPLRFSGLHERQDHQKKAEDMMNGVLASGYDSGWLQKDENGQYHIKQGQEGVTANRIHELASQKAVDFVKTVEGGDFMRQFAYQNGRQPNQQDVSNYLYNAGANQIHLKKTGDQTYQWDPKDIRNANKVNSGIASTVAPGDTQDSGSTLGGRPLKDFFKADSKDVDWNKVADVMSNHSNEDTPYFGVIYPDINGKQDSNRLSGLPALSSLEIKNKIFTLAKVAGLDKDENGRPLTGSQTFENTIKYLQNANTYANSLVQPHIKTAEAIQSKVSQQFDKNQMKDTSGETFASMETNVDKDNRGLIKFQGIDYSDKDNPRFKYQVPTSNGVENKYYTIPNNSYNSVLKPIGKVFGEISNVILGKEIPKADEITAASDALLVLGSKEPKILNELGVDNYSDLKPIAVKNIGDKTLFVYMDKKEQGATRVIIHDSKTNTTTFSKSLTNVLANETDRMFTFKEADDLLPKEQKKEEYNTED